MGQQERRPSADFSYVKRMPGLAVAAQLVTCFFAFLLSARASLIYYMSHGQGFFIFITILATATCTLWLLVRVLRLDTYLPAKFDWNLAGLVHNSVFGFLVVVASCVMVVMVVPRTLIAASVFGFFGFTGFVVALVFEASIWYRGRQFQDGMASAIDVQGPDREEDAESRQRSGDAGDGLVPGLGGDGGGGDFEAGGSIEPHGSYVARPMSCAVDERQE